MKKKYYKIFLLFIFIFSILTFGLVSTFNHTISLNGDKFITLALNEEYKEMGASNTFNSGKYIDINGVVDTTKIGMYKIEYKSNLFGFDIKRYRYVDVVDIEAPIIELLGDSSVVLCPNQKYNEDGFKAYDSYDGDLTNDVLVEEKDDLVIYSV
jgi:hypothetical protein